MIDIIIGSTLSILLWVFVIAPIIADKMAGKFNTFRYLDHVTHGLVLTLLILALCVVIGLVQMTVLFIFGEHDIFTKTYHMIVK